MATWRPMPRWSRPKPRASRRRSWRRRWPSGCAAAPASPRQRRPDRDSSICAWKLRPCAAVLPAILRRGRGLWRQHAWRRRGGERRVRLGQSDRARCISAIAAARWWATRSPTCSPRPATRSPRSTTSTTPARRWPRSPGRPTGAICRRSAPALTEEEFAAAVPGGLQYRGDYLVPVGEALARQYGTALAGAGTWHRRSGRLVRHRARNRRSPK